MYVCIICSGFYILSLQLDFDFSTLYTNIHHNLLLYSISQLISEAYRIRGAKYLVVQNDGMAYWSNTRGIRRIFKRGLHLATCSRRGGCGRVMCPLPHEAWKLEILCIRNTPKFIF